MGNRLISLGVISKMTKGHQFEDKANSYYSFNRVMMDRLQSLCNSPSVKKMQDPKSGIGFLDMLKESAPKKRKSYLDID